MLAHFQMFADYNRWANARLYAATGDLTDAEYRADRGAFFGSVHRTLNHILAADRIWMKRLTGEGEAPVALDTILHADFAGLRTAREAEDARIATWIDTLADDDFNRSVFYSNVAGTESHSQRLAAILAHVFNHQTHHRGQAHVLLTALGKPSLMLDLVAFLRSEGRRWS